MFPIVKWEYSSNALPLNAVVGFKDIKIKSMLSIRDRAQNTDSILRRLHCPALVHLCRAGTVPEHSGVDTEMNGGHPCPYRAPSSL